MPILFIDQQQDIDTAPADLALCQPAMDLPINLEYCGGDALQATFPIPSELLASSLAYNSLSPRIWTHALEKSIFGAREV
ncbi:hypothetical protein BJ912DRAFT_1058156 [Pholiota molesta]|nr:hypothetical protein BJ912DRAFT_1058156 [Pholiota molesta]